VNDQNSAEKHAKNMLLESIELFEIELPKKIYYKNDSFIGSIKIPSLTSTIFTKAMLILPNISLNDLFELLVSSEGYKLIDPFSTKQIVSNYAAGSKISILQTCVAYMEFPFRMSRDFLVLNAGFKYHRSGIFISKSIRTNNSVSSYPESTGVRAFNFFAFYVHESLSNDRDLIVHFINYLDLRGTIRPCITNFITSRYYFQSSGGLFDRIVKHYNNRKNN